MNDKPFSIHVVGETTGETWSGEFRAKVRLSHQDHLYKDRFRRELLGEEGGQSTERALSLAMIFSELRVRLVSSPSWFKEHGNGLNLADDNVIGQIFDKAIAVEREYIEEIRAKAAKAQEELREAAKKEAEENK